MKFMAVVAAVEIAASGKESAQVTPGDVLKTPSTPREL